MTMESRDTGGCDGLGKFAHTSLALHKSIRLLDLLPAANLGSPIEIRIQEVPFPPTGDHFGYEALSYTWGSPDETLPITVLPSSQSSTDPALCLHVTKNCHSALTHLRRATEERTVWIDSICIDQQCETEKSSQVQLMGDIYERATKVVVWLGEGTPDSDAAMDVLGSFERLVGDGVSKEEQRDFATKTFQELSGIGPGKSELAEKTTYDHRDIFLGLSRRPWFQRVWTMQEIALAIDAVVLCGLKSIPWALFVKGVTLLREAENDSGQYDDLSALDAFMSAHERICAALDLVRHPASSDQSHTAHKADTPPDNITNIVTRPLVRSATDPKDRVFALHGVLGKLGVGPAPVDYSRPIQDIFTDAARLAITSDESLYLLDFVGGDTGPSLPREVEDAWPSWVPKWVDKMGPYRVEKMYFYCTGRESKPVFSFDASGRKLTVRAAPFDTIAMVSDTSPWLNKPLPDQYDSVEAEMEDHVRSSIETITTFREWVQQQTVFSMLTRMRGREMPYGDEQGSVLAFVRMLVQDRSMFPGSFTDMANFEEGFNRWQRYLSALNPGSSMPLSTLRDLVPQSAVFPKSVNLTPEIEALMHSPEWLISKAIASDARASYFNMQALLACRSKRFFLSQRGLMGTAPDGIRSADRLVLVQGLEMPMVVREVDGGWRLLGPAYVQGIMHGEIWPQVEGWARDFTLV